MTRKRIVPFVFASILVSLIFSSGYAQTKKVVAANISPKDSSENIKLGKQLLLKSDCFACHNIDRKLIGPSYLEIAKKYSANEANYSYLATKIIKGGGGIWGEIPMSPHPKTPVADAKKMAEYILSLRLHSDQKLTGK